MASMPRVGREILKAGSEWMQRPKWAKSCNVKLSSFRQGGVKRRLLKHEAEKAQSLRALEIRDTT
ncbi:hypothetical protein T4D_12707 [Trichinella pseudospiralis]|uniref:Uncharacterized protein n=1 Tax=Trichinella pseudospiralis TaxID=6337 RepID=A0A0V1FLA6_TRIPS|nr:hypothetical protein T4D_12707 [Trichinella pseudospiralis]